MEAHWQVIGPNKFRRNDGVTVTQKVSGSWVWFDAAGVISPRAKMRGKPTALEAMAAADAEFNDGETPSGRAWLEQVRAENRLGPREGPSTSRVGRDWTAYQQELEAARQAQLESMRPSSRRIAEGLGAASEGSFLRALDLAALEQAAPQQPVPSRVAPSSRRLEAALGAASESAFARALGLGVEQERREPKGLRERVLAYASPNEAARILGSSSDPPTLVSRRDPVAEAAPATRRVPPPAVVTALPSPVAPARTTQASPGSVRPSQVPTRPGPPPQARPRLVPEIAARTDYKDRRRACTAQIVREALAEHGGNKRRAAQALGISRQSLYNALDRA